jgi:hypothetical protein
LTSAQEGSEPSGDHPRSLPSPQLDLWKRPTTRRPARGCREPAPVSLALEIGLVLLSEHAVGLVHGFDDKKPRLLPNREISPCWSEALPILCGEAEPYGLGGRVSTRRNLELPKDRGDVMVDGLLSHEEALGDLGVAETLSNEPEHLDLSRS